MCIRDRRSAVREALREVAAAGPAGAAPRAEWSVPERHAGASLPERSTLPSDGARSSGFEQSNLTTWPTDLPDGRIPSEISTSGGLTVHAYPALVVDSSAPGQRFARICSSGAPIRAKRWPGADESTTRAGYACTVRPPDCLLYTSDAADEEDSVGL